MLRFYTWLTIFLFCALLNGAGDLCAKIKMEDLPGNFFLQEDHPAKPALDDIFSNSRALGSVVALKSAGFITPLERHRGLVVVGHPALPGYLVKLYLDTRNVNEFEQWRKRIRGARLIQEALNQFGYNHIMKTPLKWIYLLPHDTPAANRKARYPKNSVLLVENMEIYDINESRHLYATQITPEHLDALFNILTSCKLSDSTWLPNIPFSRDGRIAFIDTEFAGETLSIWARLNRLSKNLSPEMRAYWTQLISSRSQPKEHSFKQFMLAEELLEVYSEYEELDLPSYLDDQVDEDSQQQRDEKNFDGRDLN